MRGAIPALALVLAGAVPGGATAVDPACAMRMAASVSLAVRHRLDGGNGAWFVTWELGGDAFAEAPWPHALSLFCLGASWGAGGALEGEDGMCRLSGEAGRLFARLRQVEGTPREAALGFVAFGGQGLYAGLYAGPEATLTARRTLDLAAAAPSVRGEMTLCLDRADARAPE
jgi:hypothetical protein